MDTEKIFSKTNIGARLLAHYGISKEEFLEKLIIEHPLYKVKPVDYNDETGELVMELETTTLS